MSKKKNKAKINYIEKERLCKELASMNEDTGYVVWLNKMKKACTDSGGIINADFEKTTRRRAGQIIRHINEAIPEENHWSMPKAHPQKRETYLDIARKAGLLSFSS